MRIERALMAIPPATMPLSILRWSVRGGELAHQLAPFHDPRDVAQVEQLGRLDGGGNPRGDHVGVEVVALPVVADARPAR